VPRQTATMGLTYRQRIRNVTLSASFTENFVGPRQFMEWQTTNVNSIVAGPNDLWLPRTVNLPEYWRADAALRCDFLHNHAWVKVEGTNLFDHEYEESGGVNAPGRLVTFTVGGGF
jgi:hypothetical protein